MKPGLPVWRSLLYVPVNVEKYVDKAHTRGADCILLDLEDSVPAHEKDNARKLVARAAKRVRRGGADVAVRINRPDSMTPRDLEAAVGPEVNAIAVTKVDDAAHLKRLDEIVAKLESKRGLRPGHTRFIAMVETPAAFFKRSEEHTSELQSPCNLVCRLLLEKKKKSRRNSQQYINPSPSKLAPQPVTA